MKLSYNWLKDYLKCDLSAQQIADAMTSIGIEVDGVEQDLNLKPADDAENATNSEDAESVDGEQSDTPAEETK